MRLPWSRFAAMQKLSPEEAAEFAARAAELTKAELPLGPGLRALADELPGWRLPHRFAASQNVSTPATIFSPRWSRMDEAFPNTSRGLIVAGVRSGRLAEVMEEYVDLQNSQFECAAACRWPWRIPLSCCSL